jgi:hypothetical protein
MLFSHISGVPLVNHFALFLNDATSSTSTGTILYNRLQTALNASAYSSGLNTEKREMMWSLMISSGRLLKLGIRVRRGLQVAGGASFLNAILFFLN